MSFTHLHVHSEFSILDGSATPAQLAKKAAKMGMTSIALTDSSNLFGAVAFYKACKAVNDARKKADKEYSGPLLKAIIGAELFLVPPSAPPSESGPNPHAVQVVVLVENDAGYLSLCQLITHAIYYGMHFQPCVSFETFAKHTEGLIVLTGGLHGLIGAPLGLNMVEDAHENVRLLDQLLGPDQLYFELQNTGIPGQEALNALVRQFAASTGRRLVATNPVHYLEQADAPVHETLNAIATSYSLSDPERLQSSTDQAWLKSEEEMRALFPDEPELFDITEEIAQRCDYHFDFSTYHFPATTPPDFIPAPVDPENPKEKPVIPKQPDTDANWDYFYRAFPPPKSYNWPGPDEELPPRPEGAGNINGFFDWYSEVGLALRLTKIDPAIHSTYHERLQVELDIIKGMGFPAYLLIVAEFINWSKDNGIPVGPGRGSAAGSVVAWAMGITDIDPIRFDLLFERFLNPERVSMPDIDVDFCQDRREEAITHVREKYGAPLVSQIITYGRLKAKAAIRDVSRVLCLTFDESDRIIKLIPDELGITLSEALEQSEGLADLRDGDPKVRRVIELALAVEGRCRQTGVHAAGVVIADKPLVNYAPLYRVSPEGGPVVQYDMKSAEGIGLIKFDFLGLKTLDQLRDAMVSIKRNHGVAIDMELLPLDDAPTYDLLQSGDAIGIFQLESDGMRKLLMRLKPTVIDDLVALVALYRPGPLNAGMTEDFVQRKHDPSLIDYPLPMLKPILAPTYGTIVYQEQVMQIAQVMAGYSLGGADLLRRAMGKKEKKAMEEQRGKFVAGSIKNGISAEKAESIFDLLAQFAAYGFNKSHSAAYGIISYQTAYLKAHYRAEFMAAVMTVESGDSKKLIPYIQDCVTHGVPVLPISINESMREFYVPPYGPDETAVIRYGLVAMKGVGEGAVEAILEGRRAAGGRFKSANDFFEQVDAKKLNKRVVEALAKAGGFDEFGLSRRAVFESIEAVMAAGQRSQTDEAIGQGSLFSQLAPTARPPRFKFPEGRAWPLSIRLAYERDVLGLFITGHPMSCFREDTDRHASAPIGELAEGEAGATVRALGLVVELNVVKTKRGDKMGFIRLEDETGGIECTFFPEAWARNLATIKSGEPLLVTGRLDLREQALQVVVKSVEDLSSVRARTSRRVQFCVRPEELKGKRLGQFDGFLKEHSGGCESTLVLEVDATHRLHLDLEHHPVDPGIRMEEAAQELFGRNDIVEII